MTATIDTPVVTITRVGTKNELYNTRPDSGTITTAHATYEWMITYRIDDVTLGREHAEHIYVTDARNHHLGSAYYKGLDADNRRDLRGREWVINVPIGILTGFDETSPWSALNEIVRRYEMDKGV